MKKFFIIISFLLLGASVEVSAQHYVGLRAGYGNGSVRLFPSEQTHGLWGLYNAGVSYKYYSKEKYLGGIEIDLQFIQKGYNHPDQTRPDTVYTHWVNCVELPFFWQPHLYLLNRDLRIFLNLGVVFSYNINASEQLVSKRNGPFYEKRPYDMTLVRDNRWGYGLCGGFGVNYIINRWEVMAEARYNIGYSDLYKNSNKYASNPMRSPLDNFYISAGFYYRIGKGDILSTPSKRTAGKLAEREAARVAKQAAKQKEKEPVIEPPQPVAEPESPPEEQTPPTTEKPIENGNDTPAQGS